MNPSSSYQIQRRKTKLWTSTSHKQNTVSSSAITNHNIRWFRYNVTKLNVTLNGSRTVLQADGGILDVKEIENALVANLALRNQAYEAANEGLRGIWRRSWRTVRAKITRHVAWHGCGSGRWFAITDREQKQRWRENEGKFCSVLGFLFLSLYRFKWLCLASCLPRADVAFVKKL